MDACLKKSILVVAHPDDEVLWFSSILSDVRQTVICFLDLATDADEYSTMGAARRNVLNNHPLSNVISLDIQEAGTFLAVDWRRPEQSEFGLKLASSTLLGAYEYSFKLLCKRLRPLLTDVENIFTHNPWGEYGHPDHVQVYRAIKALQPEFGFEIWYTNCCGNRSVGLAMEYIAGFDGESVVLPVDLNMANRLIQCYKKYSAWTWYNEFELFEEDVFIRDSSCKVTGRSHGKMRINMISTDLPLHAVIPRPPASSARKIMNRVKRKVRQLAD